MTAATPRRGDRAQAAPGVAEIRLSGMPADTDALLAVLEAAAGVEILSRSARYPNLRSPGQRVYVTVRVAPSKDMPEAADIAYDRLHPDPYRSWVNGEPPDRSACLASSCPPPKLDACQWPLCAAPQDRPGGGS